MDEAEAIIVVEVRYLRGLEARIGELEAALRQAREDVGVIADAGNVDAGFAVEPIDRALAAAAKR